MSLIEGESVPYLESTDRLVKVDKLGENERAFHRAMNVNGYFQLKNGSWGISPEVAESIKKKFDGESISFYGPGGRWKPFYSPSGVHEASTFIAAFSQTPVIDTMKGLRRVDEQQADRTAVILGGIVREGISTKERKEKIVQAVRFTANMVRIAEVDGADATAVATAMFLKSGGEIADDRVFKTYVYQMSKAIGYDPIVPFDTEDLGVSQLARLMAYTDIRRGAPIREFPTFQREQEDFFASPTVGAEFHFPPEIAANNPKFWQRVAILNMSQYIPGNYVQLSRNDRDVIEIRMNPSYFPFTIANWEHMTSILPELNNAFFTLTLNRKTATGGDFNWNSFRDKDLLRNLQSLGMLTYAAMYKSMPQQESSEIDFGTVYVGQTVKMNNGVYDYSGYWGGTEMGDGQFACYSGFGANFPYLAYYLPMALESPRVMDAIDPSVLRQARTIEGVLDMSPATVKGALIALDNRIKSDITLVGVERSARSIREKLAA